MKNVPLPPPPRQRLGALREHALILLLFLASRVALFAAGLRFNLDLRWMFLSDLEALRHSLLETVYYFHAFAPGMNLITGLLLKVSAAHVTTLAAGLFWAFGWLLTASLYQILVTLGHSRWAALTLALVFALLPQTLFLENLFLYNYLCAALLCAGGLLMHRALLRSSALSWLGFFLVCTALGWLYTVFHLLWFGAMLVLGLALARVCSTGASWGGAWRRLLSGAALPALLLVGLYAKNLAVFGVFGATSWGAANMTLATTQQMRPAERNQWIREAKLSPYAAINVYSPPSAYLQFFPGDLRFPWPGTNELVRPSQGEPNFNHGLFLSVNDTRRKDVAYFLETRPREYLRRVVTQNLPSLFYSSTHWHPHDRRPGSPHDLHRRVLGRYEAFYDRVVHSWPVKGVGLYVFLPVFLAWAAWSALVRLRSDDSGARAAGALLGFCLVQIAFVVSASVLFTAWETSRYRYTIEPCIWVVVVVALRAAFVRLRAWTTGLRGAPPAGPRHQTPDARLEPRDIEG